MREEKNKMKLNKKMIVVEDRKIFIYSQYKYSSIHSRPNKNNAT
jgi:hypothetical protein